MILIKIFLHNNIKRLILQSNKITMKNSIKIFLLIGSLTLLSSCCADVSKETVNSSNSSTILKIPTSLAINKSIVAARVEEILSSENGSFVVKALIINVEDNPSYPSLAMNGKSYNLIPIFQLDDNKKIISDSEKNKSLNFLSNKKPVTNSKQSFFLKI